MLNNNLKQQRAQKRKPFLIHLLFLLIILASIIGLSFPLSNKLKKQYTVNKEIKTLKEEISRESSKNNNLKNFIEYLNSDQYVEEKARTNLNYKNENETVVVIKDPSISSEDKLRDNFAYTSNKVDQYNDEKIQNAKNWIKYFFN